MTERAEAGRLPEGVWGGQHLRMGVRADGAELEFDCARGQISVPFETDAGGRFDLPGTYTRQGPGPIRVGRLPSARPVRYTGRVEGSKMSLAVRLEEGGRQLGDYALTRGDEGRVVKCR